MKGQEHGTANLLIEGTKCRNQWLILNTISKFNYNYNHLINFNLRIC